MILSRLVEDLLDLSRFQQQRVHLNIAPVDMVQVINAAIDMNRPAADAKGVRIATDVTPAPALILGDTMRLQQVVSNLISNAIKFTPAEGVVTLRLSSAATQLEIVVTDTGEGIAPEFLPHVFEPFGKGSRESGTKASASVSTGCDLSLHGVSTGPAASLRPTPPGTWKFLPPSDLIGTAYREPFRHVSEMEGSMRRSVLAFTLIAVCVLFAAPASAQVQNHDWFTNAAIGPSFGTLGSTPVVDASAGYKFTNHFSIGGEFGVLPHAPFEKAGSVAPALSPLAPSSDVHVNAYHTNANLFVHASPWGRFEPYATVGLGAFTGSTVASGSVADSRIVQYDRETNPSENFGVGTTYRLSKWLGLNADYRHFIVNATDTQHVNRFTTGVSVFVK